MERLFAAAGITLLLGAAVTFLLIIRDALPHLDATNRVSVKTNAGMSFRSLSARDRAMVATWKVHAENFPNSKKRTVFAILLIATALSVLGYPLTHFFR